MLTCVDLDLELQLQGRRVFGLESVYQVDPPLVENTTRLPEPRIQHRARLIEGFADGLCSDLDQIDVFRIPGRRSEVELT